MVENPITIVRDLFSHGKQSTLSTSKPCIIRCESKQGYDPKELPLICFQMPRTSLN